MTKFTVNRYLVVSTEIEAETAEDALYKEETTKTSVDISNENGVVTH